TTDHRLRIDELGAVHASVRHLLFLLLEQARLREFRSVHRRCEGREGAGPRHLLRRLRRAAGPVTRRQAARGDIDGVGRRRPSALPRPVESRKSARSAEERAAEEAEQEIMTVKLMRAPALTVLSVGLIAVLSAADTPSKTRAHVEALASPRLE